MARATLNEAIQGCQLQPQKQPPEKSQPREIERFSSCAYRPTCHASGPLTKFSAILSVGFLSVHPSTLCRNKAKRCCHDNFQRVLNGSFHVKWKQSSIDTRSWSRKERTRRACFDSLRKLIVYFLFNYRLSRGMLSLTACA